MGYVAPPRVCLERQERNIQEEQECRYNHFFHDAAFLTGPLDEVYCTIGVCHGEASLEIMQVQGWGKLMRKANLVRRKPKMFIGTNSEKL